MCYMIKQHMKIAKIYIENVKEDKIIKKGINYEWNTKI